jgi:hypothetical protein
MTAFRLKDFVVVSLYAKHDNPTPYFYVGGDEPFSKERAKAARYFERHDAEVMRDYVETEFGYGARIEVWTLESEHA